MPITLTDKFIRTLPPRSEIRDATQPGLIVRRRNRKIQWVLRYIWQGQRKRLVLGWYPSLSLADARQAVRDAQRALDRGEDPGAPKEAAKLPVTDTVERLAEAYLEHHARPHKDSAAADERTLNVDVLPTLGNRSVRSLTRRDVRDLVQRVVKRGSPVQANRVQALVSKMLNFAVDEEWIEANPAARLRKPTREVSRERVLTDPEIRKLWRCLERQPSTAERGAPGRKRAKSTKADPICPFGPGLAAVMKIRLITGQRLGEVLGMTRNEIDGDWWTIPGSRTKNGETHRVPLTTLALEIIAAQPARKSGVVFAGPRGPLDARAKKASALLSRVLGFEFRGHDLRRTAATRMAEAGVPREHISRVLNHVSGGPRATRVYDRYAYDAEKRQALETWERKLIQILD